MAITITMPRLSDTMEEGTLVKWRVKVGDKVASGSHLADVETDKATMDLTSYDEGTVARIVVDEGGTAAVGKPIVILAEEGESPEAAAATQGQAEPGEAAAERETVQAAPAVAIAAAPPAARAATGGRVKVSPLARKIAEEGGLDLGQIRGTGPDGRIIKRDVQAALERGPTPMPKGAPAPLAPAPAAPPAVAKPAPPAPSLTIDVAELQAISHPLSNMRKTIARRLIESKTQIPHFTVSLSVDMDPLLAARGVKAQLEQRGVKLSVNDFIVRACTLALVKHPLLNSSWKGDSIEQHGTINIGIAVALPPARGGGLVVPTLREAHKMSVQTINRETRRLATKAREQGLTLEEMSDGTFTISNLGMYGVDHFDAIINPPQAAILAIGAAMEKPVVRAGQLVVGWEMMLTISADHRVVDGATAAEFMQTLKQLLEAPAALLV